MKVEFMEKKRIKLKEPVPTFDKFTYECAKCGAMLFEQDNFCAHCGENLSNCLGAVILRSVKEGEG